MRVIHREVICVNTLQTNDWLILNSIIYEIYTTADFDGMRKKFLEQMKMRIFIWQQRTASISLQHRLCIIVTRIYRMYMIPLIMGAEFYIAEKVSYTERRILWQMRCGQKRSIMTKYISRTDGIIPYR